MIPNLFQTSLAVVEHVKVIFMKRWLHFAKPEVGRPGGWPVTIGWKIKQNGNQRNGEVVGMTALDFAGVNSRAITLTTFQLQWYIDTLVQNYVTRYHTHTCAVELFYRWSCNMRGRYRFNALQSWWRHNQRMASQITSLTIVYSTLYSRRRSKEHQSSASLAFVRGIHRWPVNSPHKEPVTRKMFPFDDVIMVDPYDEETGIFREN